MWPSYILVYLKKETHGLDSLCGEFIISWCLIDEVSQGMASKAVTRLASHSDIQLASFPYQFNKVCKLYKLKKIIIKIVYLLLLEKTKKGAVHKWRHLCWQKYFLNIPNIKSTTDFDCWVTATTNFRQAVEVPTSLLWRPCCIKAKNGLSSSEVRGRSFWLLPGLAAACNNAKASS